MSHLRLGLIAPSLSLSPHGLRSAQRSITLAQLIPGQPYHTSPVSQPDTLLLKATNERRESLPPSLIDNQSIPSVRHHDDLPATPTAAAANTAGLRTPRSSIRASSPTITGETTRDRRVAGMDLILAPARRAIAGHVVANTANSDAAFRFWRFVGDTCAFATAGQSGQRR